MSGQDWGYESRTYVLETESDYKNVPDDAEGLVSESTVVCRANKVNLNTKTPFKQ